MSALGETQSPAMPGMRVAPPIISVRKLAGGIRPSERRLLLALIDVGLVNLALLAAVWLCSDFIRRTGDIRPLWYWFVTLTVVWLAWALFFDVYNLARAASATASLRSSLYAAVATVLTYTFIPYFTPPLTSRGLIVYFAALTTAALAVWRVGYARLFTQPWFQQRALVVGAGSAGRALAAALRNAPSGDANPFRGTGYRLVGFVDDDAPGGGEGVEGLPVLGDRHALLDLAQSYQLDEIILAITHRHAIADDLFDALLRCRELGLRVVTMATVYERLTGRVPVEHVGRDLHMVVPMDDDAAERVYQVAKRAMDIVIALLFLAVVGLLAPLAALCNALTSPGPLFYRQKRVGKGGQLFDMIKFRSMRPDAEQASGAVWARPGDDRITPAGRWLRKTRLDEFPQAVNVLRGEMSIIGPRPERPEFVQELADTIPFYRARHAVRPGITGWAQIRYPYGNSRQDARAKLEYDLYYVKHASLFLDLVIILQTVPVMLHGDGL